jgi:hypothetical protein
MTEQEKLLAEAAFILEQEGWILRRSARESRSSRMGQFADRYEAWQAKLDAFRAHNPGQWPVPTDNS